MRWFLAAAASVFLVTSLAVRSIDATAPNATLVSLVTVPLAALAAVAELVRLLRRPRLFEPAARRIFPSLFLGGFTAALAMVLIAALLVLFESRLPDWTLLAAGPAVAVFATLFFLPRTRPGRCARCQYPLAGVTPATKGLCPECGHALLA